jgi:hypothetical protein
MDSDWLLDLFTKAIITTQVTITETTIVLLASRISLTEMHCTEVSLRGLNSSGSGYWRRLTSEADGQGLTPCIVFPFQHRASNNGNTDLPTVGYHTTQQYRSSERIHGNIRLRSPSNDGLRSDTSQYHQTTQTEETIWTSYTIEH